MLKLNDIKTGMKVKTKQGKFYYVIEDWLHMIEDEENDDEMITKINAVLLPADPNDRNLYGFFNYDENLQLFGEADNEWNIEQVFIYTGNDLSIMFSEEGEQYWNEVIDPINLTQEVIAKYLSKFDQ